MTTLQLTYVPIPGSHHVYLNGIEQEEGVDWTDNGTGLLTFLGPMAEASGDDIEVMYAHNGVILPDWAARIYFPSSGAAAVSPAFSSDWESTSGADRLRCVYGTHSNTAYDQPFHTKPAAIGDWVYRQYVSDPLITQVVQGYVRGVFQLSSVSNTGDNLMRRMIIRVVSNDGATVRGTILPITTNAVDPAGADWGVYDSSVTMRSHLMPPGWTDPGAALTPVTALAGDRIVIEFGCWSYHAFFSHNFRFRSGDPLGDPDLTPNNTDGTLSEVPWLEFSSLRFQ
jgi:hypothetical protein